MSRICVIGSFSGQNAGDAAILECIARDIVSAIPSAALEVLTPDPSFIERTYPDLPIKGIDTKPWKISVKTFGVPLLASIARCDAVIITQAILFDRKFFDLRFNHLAALMLGLSFARILNRKIYFYGVGVGPVLTHWGGRIVRKLIDIADGISLREDASLDVLKKLGVTRQPTLAADAALNQPVLGEIRNNIQAVLGAKHGTRSLAAVNVNAYLGAYADGGCNLSREDFIKIIAEVIIHFIDVLKLDVVLICTHFMDETITDDVAECAQRPENISILKNRHYDHRELIAAMEQCVLMLGMRLHCQILAISAGTPCVALDYLPKVRNFMDMIGQGEYVVSMNELSASILKERVECLLDRRETVRNKLVEPITALRQRARIPAAELARILKHE